ncbi:MAG: cobyrinate a,c-diamide synthase [Spirochaetia bacterium]|nr:cobyrinate a,c-diamide synthase [Spirochaetia bacterium]
MKRSKTANHQLFPRLVIGGTNSGAGKTTITLGIMAALKKRSLTVQGFKCGPDYIDPGYHSAVTERISHNLDSWFVKPSLVKQIFFNNSYNSDISIIEGVMGLFDGRNPLSDQGSSAEISQILHAPVVLVFDARSMARSAAAIVKGFQLFSKKVQIAGVIANKVGSKNHLDILREAIEKECKIPLIGGILRDEKLKIPERHLGLLPAIERGELNSLFKFLAELIENSLDLELLLQLAGFNQKNSEEKNDYKKIKIESEKAFKPYVISNNKNVVKVAVAHDAAFNFYYPENLQIMQQSGMELEYFSPLKNEPIPEDCFGLYLGGGFPEEFAGVLSKNFITKKSVIEAIEKGMPTIAECGGFMYLTKEIVDRNEKKYTMTGVLPGSVIMQSRLAALGYREITGLKSNFLLHEGEIIRGHEFHYSSHIVMDSENNENQLLSAYHLKGRSIDAESGFIYKNLIAGYAHFYFLSNPEFVKRWTRKCLEYKLI